MKNSRIVTLATFATIVFGGVETAFANPSYSFTTIDVPGAVDTGPSGINDSGQIVGGFDDGRVGHGFLLDTSGSITTIDVPGATSTGASGINDSGQIVGLFDYATGNTHGFFLDVGGRFTTIDVPGASETFAVGINNSGQIVGYFGAIGYHGFLYTGGSFTSIDVGPLPIDTFASASTTGARSRESSIQATRGRPRAFSLRPLL